MFHTVLNALHVAQVREANSGYLRLMAWRRELRRRSNIQLTTHYLLLTTYKLLLTAYCLLLNAYYELRRRSRTFIQLNIYYLLLTTYYLLLTSCYLLLATCYFLFTTHYDFRHRSNIQLSAASERGARKQFNA